MGSVGLCLFVSLLPAHPEEKAKPNHGVAIVPVIQKFLAEVTVMFLHTLSAGTIILS